MSAGGVFPTRQNLTLQKAKVIGATKGYELLKKKSDALAVRLRSLLKDIKDVSAGRRAMDAAGGRLDAVFVRAADKDAAAPVLLSATAHTRWQLRARPLGYCYRRKRRWALR